MGDTTPRKVVLGCICRQAEQVMKIKLVIRISP